MGDMASRLTTMYCMEFKHGFMVHYREYFYHWKINTKQMINPVMNGLWLVNINL